MARGKPKASPTASPKVSHKVEPNIDFSKIDYDYKLVRDAMQKLKDVDVAKLLDKLKRMPMTERSRGDNKKMYWAYERLKREGKLNLLKK